MVLFQCESKSPALLRQHLILKISDVGFREALIFANKDDR